jgi:hypothetical protein
MAKQVNFVACSPCFVLKEKRVECVTVLNGYAVCENCIALVSDPNFSIWLRPLRYRVEP